MSPELKAGTGIPEATPPDQIEILRLKILEQHKEYIAGEGSHGPKNDEWVLVRDGILRAINLERDLRAELYRRRKVAGGGVLFDDSMDDAHPDNWFSFNTLVHSYRLVRVVHNEMFQSQPSVAKIPPLDNEQAHHYLKEVVQEGRLSLHVSKSLEDIELHRIEGEPIFRYPALEYERGKGKLEEERDKYKDEAVRGAVGLANQRYLITRNPGDRYIQNKDVVNYFVGRKQESEYVGEVGMYLSDSSAEAYLRELVDGGGWERIVAYNSVTDRSETYYRPVSQEDSGE